MIIDDYGHHPSEIKLTLQAIRLGWPEYRVITVFQPHRYSRTKLLLKDFGSAFHDSDVVIVNDIYPARKPIPNISGELLYQEIKNSKGRCINYIPGREETVSF